MVSRLYHGSPNDVTLPQKDSPSVAEVENAWKNWAATSQRSGTPTIVQLCHPGRQSPRGAGARGLFEPSVAPSAVRLNFGEGFLTEAIVTLGFGTPREMTVDEIDGPNGVIEEFVAAAKHSFEAGFKGVELHAA
jgi:2,4-dienoyl-CoA reductase-like NADH-dependent reductase (Old Yellow Enzyme family)